MIVNQHKEFFNVKPHSGAFIDWSNNLAKGLSHCYLFTERNGGVIRDLVSKYDGTVTSMSSPSGFGHRLIGRAIDFDGTGYVVCNSAGTIPTWPFTVMAIVRPNTFGTGTTRTFFSSSMFSSAGTYIQLGQDSGGAGTFWVRMDNETSTGRRITGSTNISTFDSAVVVGVGYASNNHILFLNGVQDGSKTGGGQFPPQNTVTLGMVGRNSAYTTDPANGVIEAIFIWKKRALYSREILDLSIAPLQFIKSGIKRLFNFGVSASTGGATPYRTLMGVGG